MTAMNPQILYEATHVKIIHVKEKVVEKTERRDKQED